MNMFGGTSANIKSHVMEQQTSDEEGERLLQGPEGDFFDSIGGLMAEAFDDTFGEDVRKALANIFGPIFNAVNSPAYGYNRK